MPRLSILGVLTNVQILFHTFLKGEKVGEDHLGNVYYKGKPRRGQTRERRWVIYKDRPEASLIPPEWHGWIHHQTDRLPADGSPYRKSWQKPAQPNLTGTEAAYLPPGHVLRGQQRDAATGDYTPWQPPQ